MTRKIFLFSLTFFILTGLFLGSWFFFFKKDKNFLEEKVVSLENENINKKEESENEKKGRIEKIIDGKIQGIQLKKDSDELVYFYQNNFLLADLDGKVKTNLGAYPFDNIKELHWSDDYEKIIVKNGDNFSIFDLENGENKSFKNGADNLIWGRGYNLIYKFYDSQTKKRTLNVSNLAGDNWQEISEIPFREAEIILNPKSEIVAVFSKPDFLEESQIFIIDLIKKDKKNIPLNKKGASFKWSPDGKKILFSYVKETGGLGMAVLDADNEKIVELNFPGLQEKCVWGNNSEKIYCANPAFENQTKIVLPNDWISGEVFSADTFWEINTKNGKQKRLIEIDEMAGEIFDVEKIFLNEKENKVFFVDRRTGSLFAFNL